MSTSAAYLVPPGAVLDVCLCHCSRRTARAISRVYDAALAPLGLSSGQFTLLAAIAAQAPVTIAGLSEIMLMESSTLSRNLAPLRRAGLVTWSGNAGRRAGHIALTEAGEQSLGAALTAWQGAQSQVSQRLGGGAAGNLLQLLEKAAHAAG